MTRHGHKKLKMRIRLAAAVITAGLFLSACGSDGSDLPEILSAQEEYGTIAPEEVNPEGEEAESVPQSSGGGSEPAQSVVSDNGRRVVYLILPSDEGFSAREREIITENLIEKGYGVAVRIYHDSTEQQTACFSEAIHSRPAAIICDNTYEDAARASVRAAREADVPTFLMDQGIDLSGVAQGQLVVDRCGRADDLVRYFIARSDAEIAYIMLGGAEEDSRSLDMMDLIKHALNRYVQATSLAEDRQRIFETEDAAARIKTMLDEHPEANTVICYNTQQTEKALEVLDERGIRGNMRVLCVSGDRDRIKTLVESGQVEAAIVEPAETLAEMVSDDVFRYFRTGSPEWSERRYIMADILTKDGIWDGTLPGDDGEQ